MKEQSIKDKLTDQEFSILKDIAERQYNNDIYRAYLNETKHYTPINQRSE